LVKAMHAVADQVTVVLPLHPRGRARLRDAGLFDHPKMKIIDPLGYVEFMGLVRGSNVVITDSGGVQEETTILGVPCLTLRPNTERPITITHGTNQLVTRESLDRKSTCLNSSHVKISYAVFCLKKKMKLTKEKSFVVTLFLFQ